MDLGLAGKSAVVTGASRGIGLGCAKSLAREGSDVCLVAQNAERLADAIADVRAFADVKVTSHVADLTNTDALLDVISAYPEADILVNNAGAIPGGTLMEIDAQRWRKGWELKVFGYIDATRAMLEHMYAHGRGVVVNVIGTGGVAHSYEYVAGAAGNSALIAFTNAVGARSVDHGVRVVGVNPGAIDTERHRGIIATMQAKQPGGSERSWLHYLAGDLPFGRAGRVEEIGDVVAFLASDRASYISGTVINVDAGRLYR
jgi:NAD(P)-dependent dehydrogenase (short-subunit alcohol dehydrogenase family)